VFTCAIWSILRGNSRKINKKWKKFDYYRRLGGYIRTRGGHDDRRDMDAAISCIHDKQKVTKRCSGGQEDNSKIENVCHVTGEVIQEKYFWRLAALCNAPRRTKNTTRHTWWSMRPSC
jgi:hypothetical protein